MNLVINSIFLSILFLALTGPANAYLDPGSGSFILQIILGAVLGGLFTVKVYWQKVKALVLKIFKKTESNNKHAAKDKQT